MATGTVKWFNGTKGFGFIAPDDGGKDVFVHISAVERAGLTGLNDNQKVEYELQSGRDGRACGNCRNSSPQQSITGGVTLAKLLKQPKVNTPVSS